MRIIKANMNINNAFTLAEVLLVLSVIGVVAALTIPTLIQKITGDQTVVRVKKVYSILSQATMSLIADNGGSLVGVFANVDDVSVKYQGKISFVKTCPDGQALGNCWPAVNHWLGGGNTGNYQGAGAILSDGTLLRFYGYYFQSDCNSTVETGTVSKCDAVWADINGFSGPNSYGIDQFGFYIQRDRLLPMGVAGDTNSCQTGANGWWPSQGCTAKVLQEGVINY